MALGKKVQSSYVSAEGTYKINADFYKFPREPHQQQFQSSSIALDTSKLYLDDDQIKIHESHARKVENTRKDIQK